MASAQVSIRAKGSNKCARHYGMDVIFCCKECSDELVCTDCATSSHQGHKLFKLADEVEVKRRNIKLFIENAEKNVLPRIVQEIDSVQNKLTENFDSLQKNVMEIRNRGENLKKQIDNITMSLTECCKTLEQENAKLLQRHKVNLEALKEDWQAKLKNCKDLLNSSEDARVFDVEAGIKTMPTQPKHPDQKVFSFQEGTYVGTQLVDGFGKVSTQIKIYMTEEEIQKKDWELQRYFWSLVKIISETVETVTTKTSDLKDISIYDPSKFVQNPQEQMLSVINLVTEGLIQDAREKFSELQRVVKIAPSAEKRKLWDDKTRSLEADLNKAEMDFKQMLQTSESAITMNKKSTETTTPPLQLEQKTFEPLTNKSSVKNTCNKIPSPISTFQKPGLKLMSLCPNSIDSVWIPEYFSKTVLLYNKNGDIKQTIEQDRDILDISVSPVTQRVWICCEDKCIREQVKIVFIKSLKVRFQTDFLPLRLVLTHDNRVVVIGQITVCVYTVDGSKLQSVTKGNSGTYAVTNPQSLAVCPLTSNIAVCNKDDKPHVVVLDKNLRVLFRYYGQSPSENASFDITDAVFDNKGNLLIAVRDSTCILVLSKDGGYFGKFELHESRAVALGNHQSEILWVGFENGTVKTFDIKSGLHLK